MRQAVLTLALLVGNQAFAAPGFLPVQGELTDDAGAPIDDALEVTFTLYEDAGGASSVWNETQVVDFERGSFTALLGDEKALDLSIFKDHPRGLWLGVRVKGADEMSLIPLGTAPYAAFAEFAGDAARADSADRADVADRATDADKATNAVNAESAEDADALGGYLASEYRLVRDKVKWSDISGTPTGLADGDDDTTYLAGTGLLLSSSDEFSVDESWLTAEVKDVCYDTSSEIRAVTDPLYLQVGKYTPAWKDLTGVPSGFADGTDDDTTYSAGTGMVLSGTTFIADKTYITDEAKKVCYDTKSELKAVLDAEYLAASYTPAWTDLSGIPSGFADGIDNNTSYTAGAGLNLSGSTLSADLSWFETELDKLYRGLTDKVPWADVSGVPADLADGDDVGVLPEDLADEIEALTALDLPAGTTVGGQAIPAASISKPLIQFGFMGATPYTYNMYGSITDFPRHFKAAPSVILGIDESMDDSGASWCRHRKQPAVNRMWWDCNTAADGVAWMAVERGRHTISGKEVEAGRISAVNNNDSVFFSKTFPKAPVVLLLAETNEHWRIIGSAGATTGGFQIAGLNRNGSPMQWVALEPGDYTYNGWHFEAGIIKDPDNGDTFSYTGTFKSVPNLFYTVWDTDNSGAVYTRTMPNTTSTQFQIYVDSNSSEWLYYVAAEEIQ
jgi:hypothetical protein